MSPGSKRTSARARADQRRKSAPQAPGTNVSPQDSDTLLRDEAKQTIMEKILARDRGFRSGDLLTERKIVTDLRLTRAPVRQALNELETEGVLTIRPRIGAMVNSITEDQVQAHMATRFPVETLIVWKLAGEPNVDLGELEAVHARMGDCVSATEKFGVNPTTSLNFIRADLDFHTTMARLAPGYETNAAYLRSMCAQVFLYVLRRGRLSTVDEMRAVWRDHQAILQALRDHNREAAREALHSHLRTSAEQLLPIESGYIRNSLSQALQTIPKSMGA
jgi:DNA-binding GntR family transcriptional regulator